MINQEFKALERKYQALPNFGICCRKLGGSKLRVFVHACAVSALSSKVFNCIRHDLLIAELHAYGFSREALALINNYLTNRQQRVNGSVSFLEKRSTRCSTEVSLRASVIQDSDICNYSHDTTIIPTIRTSTI